MLYGYLRNKPLPFEGRHQILHEHFGSLKQNPTLLPFGLLRVPAAAILAISVFSFELPKDE